LPKFVLVTGASGYIASRLIPRLLQNGYRIRCLARDPSRLAGRSWAASVEIVEGDLLRPETLTAAMQGVQAAFYLIHSMASGIHYPELDLLAARNFALAAESAGLEQIIYLGGLADPEGPISPHMRSRIDTGRALQEGSIPVTEFRAGVIIGPGSISFEMIRYISEQFPILPGPVWLRNLSQPIAIADVISYLSAALETPASRGQVIEIGGMDVMTHADSMLAYARQRGLKRTLFTVPPFIPASWIALLVGLLTPVPASIARPLIGGLQAPSIVRRDNARRIFPDLQPVDYKTALAAALAGLTPSAVEPFHDPRRRVQSLKQEGFLLDVRQVRVEAPPEAVFSVLAGLGGRGGWLYADMLWRLRGGIDRLIDGPGMRGRPETLAVDAVVDFYRVEILEPGKCLRLRAELKAPGLGWMEWRVLPDAQSTRLVQIAWFAPRGLPGFLYWYLLAPIHRFVFAGLLKRIAAGSRRSR
jgi:uncharacterized protein YbjT (DUF2867 family)